MALNTKRERIVQIVNPFDQDFYKLKADLVEESSAVYYQGSSGQELPDEEGDEPSLRISTRARTTYELDRFNKNEMLIIYNINTDAVTVGRILNAFRTRKFDFTIIETEHNDENETWQKIYQFMQKDFSNIGMIAVATSLSSPGPDGSRTNRVKEWDVLKYFMENQPATFQGKPKLFISETLTERPAEWKRLEEAFAAWQADMAEMEKERNGTEPRGAGTNIPWDTVVLVTGQELGARPLAYFWDKLTSMEGDLMDIVFTINNETRQMSSPIQIKCVSRIHLHKQLLWKRSEN